MKVSFTQQNRQGQEVETMDRPDCTDCPDPGACCRYYRDLLVGILLTDEEGPRYSEALPTPLGYFLSLKPGTGECIFLDDWGLCAVHHTRKPEVCRNWHCVDDFDQDGRPSSFLEEHPHILQWLMARRNRSDSTGFLPSSEGGGDEGEGDLTKTASEGSAGG